MDFEREVSLLDPGLPFAATHYKKHDVALPQIDTESRHIEAQLRQNIVRDNIVYMRPSAHPGAVGGGIFGNVYRATRYTQITDFRNLAIESTLELSEPIARGLPLEEQLREWPYDNATNLEQSFEIVFEHEVRTGTELRFEQVNTKNTEVSGKLTFKLPIGKGELGGELGGKKNWDVKITKTNTINETETKKITQRYPIRIPQLSINRVSLKLQQFETIRRFSGQATVVGECTLFDASTSEAAEWTPLDYLFDERQRTVMVGGHYVTREYYVTPLNIESHPMPPPSP